MTLKSSKYILNITDSTTEAMAPMYRPHSSSADTHLSYDISVSETDHNPIFGSVVLRLVLNHQTLASTIVSLTLYNKGGS